MLKTVPGLIQKNSVIHRDWRTIAQLLVTLQLGRTELSLKRTVKNLSFKNQSSSKRFTMYNTTIITLLFTAILESLIINVGNIFTIFVFWKHRHRLKRTSFLLINLAVADLLVGFTEPIALGTYLPRRLKESSLTSITMERFSPLFKQAFLLRLWFFSHSFHWNLHMLWFGRSTIEQQVLTSTFTVLLLRG